MANPIIYLLLESNYYDVIHHILQVHNFPTANLTTPEILPKNLKKIPKDNVLITDYILLAQHYGKIKNNKIICLIPNKIKINHNLKNTIFYELPIRHGEFMNLIAQETKITLQD